MRSSDFERLGDWQRKQIWGFQDALNDVVTRTQNIQRISSSISTDRSTLERKTTKQEQGRTFTKKR